MKKVLCIIIFALFSTVIFTSCTSNKSINIAKDYVDEYYKNFSQHNATQCYYQLNKNSSDKLEEKYDLGVEDLISSRSRILGSVIEYEILSDDYYKEGQDKFVNFDILVKYQNAEIQESYQIVIKKDGQTSINDIVFPDDYVVDEFINIYKNFLITNDTGAVSNLASEQYYESKTERNLVNMIEQAGEMGGKLWSCEIVESNYSYQELNIGAYVYEALLEMKYENTTMHNKIKVTENNGELGIGYTIILPSKVLTFYENYVSHLKNEDKNSALAMYSPEMYSSDEDRENKEWEKLLSYSKAYGYLLDYEVLAIGADNFQMADGSFLDTIVTEALFNYKNKFVKHKITLIENANGDYIIFEQRISDD